MEYFRAHNEIIRPEAEIFGHALRLSVDIRSVEDCELACLRIPHDPIRVKRRVSIRLSAIVQYSRNAGLPRTVATPATKAPSGW